MVEFAPPDFERKIVMPERLPQVLNTIDRPLVFTNGCFDIVHRGHVSYLAQAKQLGKRLIVALNTDASVKRQGKGLERPINPLSNRMAVIAALESVDLVTFFDEGTPFNLIELIQPEILVKGGDWQPENIVGASQTIARGGKVFSIPFLYETSTTAVVQKIRNSVTN
ncbi:MAG: D-glycero-beta-D-manno-heptose 1-phosphate adenylyltransferase [Neisseriaceae bacterium]|nr:D-glycero-beta-D-manno-heptose 1-phosphate adenylyltransferase [Neisseriaceae bacterium]